MRPSTTRAALDSRLAHVEDLLQDNVDGERAEAPCDEVKVEHGDAA